MQRFGLPVTWPILSLVTASLKLLLPLLLGSYCAIPGPLAIDESVSVAQSVTSGSPSTMAFWLLPQWHSSMHRGGILPNRRLLEDKIHACFVQKKLAFCFPDCLILILPRILPMSIFPYFLLFENNTGLATCTRSP